MIQTMIIDDDFLVRAYLKQLHAWHDAGFEIIAEARDGEEALRMILEMKPDVIVTDISMPLMDGIELIRQIRSRGCDTYLIVLSCYDDFQYVKEAMRLGANEYVLKNSLDEQSLYELLKNAEIQIEGLRVISNEQERTEKLIKIGSHSLKYHFFNQLLSGTMTLQEREEKRKEAGIAGKFINSAVINMFIPKWVEMKEQLSPLEAEQYSQAFLHRLTRHMDTLLGEDSLFVEEIYLGEGIFCCFLDLSAMCRSSLMKQKLTSVASACFRCCKEESYQYALGVSNICIGEEGIKQAYQQAREMIKLHFYEEEEILYFDSEKSIGHQCPHEAQDLLDHLTEYVSGKQVDKLKNSFELAIQYFRKYYVEPKLVLQWVKEMDSKIKLVRSFEDYFKIIKIEQLRDICEDYQRRLLEERRAVLPKGVSKAVRQAIDYIHRHYKSPIGLVEVAEAVGLNHAYLSFLFKQEMGIGFSNYLLECRMESSKELLKNTSYKIKEVAEAAGFNDYHYFSKAFKKLNGCSPAEFRKGVSY